jgi:antitoxin component YwqK of YwqJK toxin-antitoxin module
MSEPLYKSVNELELVGFDGANGEIYNYDEEPFTGFLRRKWGNGAPISDVEYKHGYKEGAVIEYSDPDRPGFRREEYHVKYGCLNGDYKRWNKKGELIYHARWKDNEEEEVYFGKKDNYQY